MVIKEIKQGFRILYNPKKEFDGLSGRTLEAVVGDYIKLLISLALVSAVFNFAYSVGKAVYLDIFLNIDVRYLRMINYSLGMSVSLLFLCLFIGTFMLFFVSVLLNAFLVKVKYTPILKILLYSVSPLLLFGWLPFTIIPFIIWSVFLFVIGVKSNKNTRIKTSSITQRD